jgi:hypothetical protein
MAAPTSRPVFPPEYKKRLFQGVAAWLAILAAAGFWAQMHAADTLKDIEIRTPHATASVKAVYLTPQITDTAPTLPVNEDATGFTASDQGAYIALIVTGLGLSDNLTQRAIDDLPAPVTLAFSPYSDLLKWVKEATDSKHESLLLLPMEPVGYPKDDPGPKTLLTRVSRESVAENLDLLLKNRNGAIGVMNFMGSAFLADSRSLPPVFESLHKAGAIFVENRGESQHGPTQTLASAVAAQMSLPYIGSDLVIDSSATETDIGQQLVALEKLAQQQGYAVGTADPYPASLNIIKAWSKQLETHGITLVPISAILKAKARHDGQQQQKQ